MVLELQKRFEQHLRAVLAAKYELQLESIPMETPPELKFGELATPIAFELARKLRKAPKMIAQEIVAALGHLDGFASFEVAGTGYINARLDRAAGVRRTARPDAEGVPPTACGFGGAAAKNFTSTTSFSSPFFSTTLFTFISAISQPPPTSSLSL